jgi:putative ABC transport system substrate-binding protein
MRELGWTDGKDVVFEVRAGGSDPARIAALVEELVAMKVDVLVTSSTPAAVAAKAATRTIPVVFTMVSDPVESGLVASLARPGGNLTGWSNILPETSGTLLGLLVELVPALRRVAVLFDANNAGKRIDLREIQRAAQGMTVQALAMRSQKEIAPAFAALARDGAQAAIVLQDAVTFPNRGEVVRLAAQHRIPAAYQLRDYVTAGGLLSYGLDLDGQNQRTAAYLDRILKGARPADLPVEQPTHFELVLNVKAARAIGITFPQSVLLRADRVIE